MDDKRLIELVKSQPTIYDLSHTNYMDMNYRCQIWNDIGKELGVSGAACKTRWSNIRDNFRKSLNKNVAKRDQGQKPPKLYKYHDKLNFMVKHFGCLTNIENITNIDSSTLESLSNADSPYRTTSPVADQLTPSPASYESCTSQTDQSEPSTRRRAPRRLTDSSQVLNYILRQNKHPVDKFLSSLAPALKDLHPCDLFSAKSEIFAVVQKYEAIRLKKKYGAPCLDSSTVIMQDRSEEDN